MGTTKETEEVDVMRDTPVRLLGYANELGESFRPVLPALVVPSYVVAMAYVLADVEHKRRQQGTQPKMVSAALDTLAWQTLASVALPGMVINRVVWATQIAVSKAVPSQGVLARWTPVGCGLAAIPWIVQPIDNAVDALFDATVRKYTVHDS